MTCVLVGLENANDNVAPVVSTAQFVVPSRRVRHVFARDTSPRYRWTNAVLNSLGVSGRATGSAGGGAGELGVAATGSAGGGVGELGAGGTDNGRGELAMTSCFSLLRGSRMAILPGGRVRG